VRSLLIGINYTESAMAPTLSGCHNDVKKMKRFIQSKVSASDRIPFHWQAGTVVPHVQLEYSRSNNAT